MSDVLLPEPIEQLCGRCAAHVRNRFSVELDFSPETVSLLDHFVEAVIAEEHDGSPPPAGHQVRQSLVHLFAPTLGAYFGETVRRKFAGRWRFTEREPLDWRLEFDRFFLRLHPVGIAAWILTGTELPDIGALFTTAPKFSPLLSERLAAAPPVEEAEFFRFTTFFDTVHLMADFLVTVAKDKGGIDCSAHNYDLILRDQ